MVSLKEVKCHLTNLKYFTLLIHYITESLDHGKPLEYPGIKTKSIEVSFQIKQEPRNLPLNNLMLLKKNKMQPIRENRLFLAEEERIKLEGNEEVNP